MHEETSLLKALAPWAMVVIAAAGFYASAKVSQHRVGVLEEWRKEVDRERLDFARWKGAIEQRQLDDAREQHHLDG